MKTRGICAALVVCSLMLGASVAAWAEDVAFPEVTDAKVVRDDWYGIFAEGKKIGYSNVRVSEIRCDEKPCLLIETIEVDSMKAGDKEIKREQTDRAIVEKMDFAPMYHSSVTAATLFKSSVIAKAEKGKDCWKLTVTRTFNDKSATETKDIPSKGFVYFDSSLRAVYRELYLKSKISVTFHVFDLDNTGARDKNFGYGGERTEGEGDKAVTYQLLQDAQATLWYAPDGTVARLVFGDNTLAGILTDEKSALDPGAKMEDYKAPDYITGNVMTAKPLGVKLTRPNDSWVVMNLFEQGGFVVADYFNEASIGAIVFSGVPKGVDSAAALARMREIYKGRYTLGDGQEVDAGKNKCLRGALTANSALGADNGEYFIFMPEGRAVCIVAAASGDTYAAMRKDLAECVNSIEFVAPEVDEAKLIVTDGLTGLQMRRPGAGWMVITGGAAQGTNILIVHAWTQSRITVRDMPANPKLTADTFIKEVTGGAPSLGGGDFKAGEYQGKWVDIETAQGDATLVFRFAAISRENDLIFIQCQAAKENWEALKPDIDAMIQSLNFEEQKP